MGGIARTDRHRCRPAPMPTRARTHTQRRQTHGKGDLAKLNWGLKILLQTKGLLQRDPEAK